MDSEDEDVERGFDVYGTQRVDMDNFITFDEDDGDEQEGNDDGATKNQDQQQQHRLQKQQSNRRVSSNYMSRSRHCFCSSSRKRRKR